MVSENSREALDVRNAFSYVDNTGSVEGSNPKANTTLFKMIGLL